MPLSEFLRMARKNELSQQKACPTSLASRPGNDFVELVWENGQIMMQGQSSRATTNLPPNPNKAGESRILKFGGPDSISNNISPIVVPSDEFNLSQDDEMVPWLDALVQDYSSVFLPEISGYTINNGMSAQNSFQSGVSKLQGASLTLPTQHHHQTSDALGSGVSDINNNNYDNNNRRPDVQIIRPPTNNSNTSNHLNFSHFARPANLVKSKVSPGVESNQVKITPVANCVQPVGNEVKDSCPAKRIENLCQEKNDKPVNPSNTSDLIKCGEQIVEPIVASSSVGSGNSGGRVSCEQTLNSKRKFRDTEESECRSDDVDTESVGVKRSTQSQGNGSKRSRASEVHNLSERRRRDRINEKMRALQELIPNCNKADKASMLDEAIEYLKTLQLQVQVKIMSMGAGLCMPQMMFTPGMQHMHPAHIPHFPPMGMGMGFGMGMLDMNIGSPVFPVLPLQQPHFPANIQRMPGGPVYGHPSQGFHNSSMGLSGFRNGGQNVVLNTSPVLNSGVIANTNSQMNRNVEAGNSINPKSDQVHATNGVPNRSATVQENKQSTGASGPTADISKQPGGH